MKNDKMIKLTEIYIGAKERGFFQPDIKFIEKEFETYVVVNKIASFSKIIPENVKDHRSFFSSEAICIDLKPYTYVEIVGGKNIKVLETPETIRKLMNEK
jgi:hypothetical protein